MDSAESRVRNDPLSKTSYRRLEAEVYKLVRLFQSRIDASEELKRRVSFFWPTEEFLQRVLFTLAGDIPRGRNPLWEDDSSERFPNSLDEHSKPATAQAATSQSVSSGSRGRQDISLERNRAMSIHMNPEETLQRRRKTSNRPACVRWLGLRGADNGFAAIKLSLPGTFEPWITWANRLILFLFLPIPGYSTPEDFVSCLGAPDNSPFPMRCEDPLCVRLSHIKVTLKLGQVVDQHAGRGAATNLKQLPPSATNVPGGFAAVRPPQSLPRGQIASFTGGNLRKRRGQQQFPTDSGSGSSLQRFESNVADRDVAGHLRGIGVGQQDQQQYQLSPAASPAGSPRSWDGTESTVERENGEPDRFNALSSIESDSDSESNSSGTRSGESSTFRMKPRRPSLWSPGFDP